MFKRFSLFLAALVVCVSAHAAVTSGEKAPDFEAIDTLGATQKLSDYKGKIVVLEWKNHKCPFTNKHYSTGNMQMLQDYAKAKGIVWLSVISSAPGQEGYVTPDEANQIARQEKSNPAAIILDPKGELGHLYGAKTTPHMFVIDKTGALAYQGAIDDKPTADKADVKTAYNYVKAAMDALLAGKPVKDEATAPYGCGVKY